MGCVYLGGRWLFSKGVVLPYVLYSDLRPRLKCLPAKYLLWLLTALDQEYNFALTFARLGSYS